MCAIAKDFNIMNTYTLTHWHHLTLTECKIDFWKPYLQVILVQVFQNVVRCWIKHNICIYVLNETKFWLKIFNYKKLPIDYRQYLPNKLFAIICFSASVLSPKCFLLNSKFLDSQLNFFVVAIWENLIFAFFFVAFYYYWFIC